MQRGSLAGTGFSERERAGIEIQGRQRAPAVRGFAPLAPMQASGDHEMEYQKEVFASGGIARKLNGDPFTNAAQPGHFALVGRFDGRGGGSQQEWPGNLHTLENMAKNALLQRFHVNNDVR